MRFATKYDWWIVLGLCVAPAFSSVAVFRQKPHWDAGGAITIFMLWLAAMSACWPQYYRTRGDAFFIRQGWRKITIPYAQLTAVMASSDARSAAVFSTDRVLVETSAGKRYIIAPADQPGFFAEIAARAPQLEPCAGGLHLPLAGLPSI